MHTMRRLIVLGSFSLALGAGLLAQSPTPLAPLPLVQNLDLQPFAGQVRRLLEATDYLGAPFSAEERRALEAAFQNSDTARAVEAIQRLLDAHCLVGIQINPESRVKVAQGPARLELVEKGWRQFLVKVQNEAGVTAELRAISPNARSVHDSPWQRTVSDWAYRGREETADSASAGERDRWLDLQMFNQQPLRPTLSGLGVEYRIIQLYSRDAGQREGRIAFDVGQGTQDLGFRNEIDLLFRCLPASAVTFRVQDEQGQPTTARFTIRDQAGRVHPSQAKRLAPDFAFHPQVYRADGEIEHLPPGEYTVEYTRGPEYLPRTARWTVAGPAATWTFKLERWIDPAQLGWWSGDHHIHAAGCAHYTSPTEGVHAPDMLRHCLGEDLKVGANLTWGPCFDYQKQFFTGSDDPVSTHPYLLHYDVEVSGFGSHQSGHLCLLRLKEQIYPGGDSSHHWPTLGLNTLRWAKRQGAITGPAHSGWGLEVRTDELPNHIVPPYDGIGANEYIVDVTHQVPGLDGQLVPAVDFISTVDTPYVWELNIWYHTLNVGFRTRISGETDFPCIYGERVGLGRSYVKLDGPLNYHDWCEGIREGRNYVGDGFSHLLEFRASALTASSPGSVPVHLGVQGSELKLPAPDTVRLNLSAAAWLPEPPNPAVKRRSYTEKPYWDLERARIGDGRQVLVELIVNGHPVARQIIVADGSLRELTFETHLERSSWVAARILPSSHTNPIWVTVDDRPVRASRRSAEWCLKGVDQCWSQKERFIKADELEQARAAYDHARQIYRQLILESHAD
jgi:hypothetical protein